MIIAAISMIDDYKKECLKFGLDIDLIKSKGISFKEMIALYGLAFEETNGQILIRDSFDYIKMGNILKLSDYNFDNIEDIYYAVGYTLSLYRLNVISFIELNGFLTIAPYYKHVYKPWKFNQNKVNVLIDELVRLQYLYNRFNTNEMEN